MDGIAQLQRLGWEWRQNGVILRVETDQGKRAVFIPLSRVWVTFGEELAAVGCPCAEAAVGEDFSVGGFFSFVSKAVKGAGNLVKKVVPKSIQRAASKVVSVAKKYGSAAISAIKKVPILGTLAGAAGALMLMPAAAVSALVQGRRIDRIAIDSLKRTVGAVKQIAPYVQTVISMVPGVGTGISAGLGGALALASGQPISEAMLAAAKAALPGGALAASAFEVAKGAIQGKSIDQIALNALPIPAQQKAMLLKGLSAAKQLADGKSVSQVVIDQAMHALPPELQKAVQVGVALGHGQNLQGAVKNAAGSALALAQAHGVGVQAAQHYARGIRTPQVLHAMQKGVLAKQTVSRLVSHAQAGQHQAHNIVHALSMFRRAA